MSVSISYLEMIEAISKVALIVIAILAAWVWTQRREIKRLRERLSLWENPIPQLDKELDSDENAYFAFGVSDRSCFIVRPTTPGTPHQHPSSFPDADTGSVARPGDGDKVRGERPAP